MKTGPITASIRCSEYYTFSKSYEEYIPKYGGYTTDEFPVNIRKGDCLWTFLTYTVNGKVVRRQVMVDDDQGNFRIETTEIQETEEPSWEWANS